MSKAQEESDRYHREYYSTHKLFEPGTWIEKPNSALMEIGDKLLGREEIAILDLGSGVGRNAIPLARLLSRQATIIDCVDIIDVAIERLRENASLYNVSDIIKPVVANVGDFQIAPGRYDLIMAMSVLEHAVESERFGSVITRIQKGAKIGGFNCLSITTNLAERDCETGEAIAPVISTEISSRACEALLRDLYRGWEIQRLDFSRFTQRMRRGEREVEWSADYCLFVAACLG